MPRPKTKSELLSLSEKNYKSLMKLVESYSEEELNADFPKGPLNRNIRDVIAHLHEWHLLMLEWYRIGMQGVKPDMPAKGYTWKTLPLFNEKVWQKNRNTELEIAKNLLEDSYSKVRSLITKHTDEELFEKKRYHWTGSTSLGAYLISNTSSHYDWATKLIKKYKK